MGSSPIEDNKLLIAQLVERQTVVVRESVICRSSVRFRVKRCFVTPQMRNTNSFWVLGQIPGLGNSFCLSQNMAFGFPSSSCRLQIEGLFPVALHLQHYFFSLIGCLVPMHVFYSSLRHSPPRKKNLYTMTFPTARNTCSGLPIQIHSPRM